MNLSKYFFLISLSLILLSPQSSYSKVFVTAVKGKVSFKTGARWIPLRLGRVLIKGASIMTGVRSGVTLNFDGHTVKLRQLSKMKIYQNIRSTKNSINRIGLKFGSVNAKIKKLKKVKTVFKISTPVATSSVRGTEQEVSYWKSKGMVIIVLSGIIGGESRHGNLATVKGIQRFVIRNGKVRPEHPLHHLFNTYFTNISDLHLTDTEKAAYIQGDIDSIDSQDFTKDSPLNIIEKNSQTSEIVTVGSGAEAPTNIIVIWP